MAAEIKKRLGGDSKPENPKDSVPIIPGKPVKGGDSGCKC